MIYVDSKFRFYDDSKDLGKWPELKPTPEAVALTDEQVTEITADITKWRWHPVENKPYKLPDADKKYWKTVDGVILEMSVEEKAAVDQAEADALAAKLAAEQAAAEAVALAQAKLGAKIAAIADAKAAIASLVPAVDKATDIEGLKKVVLDLIKNVQAITA
jgi:regulator of protease activity HflC (stomatin/prohibitin superfamily)